MSDKVKLTLVMCGIFVGTLVAKLLRWLGY
jgi:hypothetical protein